MWQPFFTLPKKHEKQDHERGVVHRACNDLLSLMELAKEGKSRYNFSATVSIYHIYKDKIVDLIEATPASKLPLEVKFEKHNTNEEFKTIEGLSEHPIRTSTDISRYMERANTMKRKQAVEERQKDLDFVSHTIILIRLYNNKKGVKELISQIQFVKLACTDSCKDRVIQFEKLFDKLVKHSMGESIESKDPLSKCLDLSMLPFCPVLFFSCVHPGANKLQENIFSLQFASNMRATLVKHFTTSEQCFQEKEEEIPPIEHGEQPIIKPALHEDSKIMEEFGSRVAKPIVNISYNHEDRIPQRLTQNPQEKDFEAELSRLRRQVQKYEMDDMKRKQYSPTKHYEDRPIMEGEQSSVAYDAFYRDPALENQRIHSRKEQLLRELSESSNQSNTNIQESTSLRDFPQQNIEEPSIHTYKTAEVKERIKTEMPIIQDQRESPAFIPPSLTFSADAQKIVNKYAKSDVVPENIPILQNKKFADQADHKELTEKMRKIKNRASNISKTLAAIAESSKYSEKKEEQAKTFQQYQDLYNEVKSTQKMNKISLKN